MESVMLRQSLFKSRVAVLMMNVAVAGILKYTIYYATTSKKYGNSGNMGFDIQPVY